MASVLAAYYILISTCKMLKDLVLEYLKKNKAMVQGRRLRESIPHEHRIKY